jgi:hypothetical protein
MSQSLHLRILAFALAAIAFLSVAMPAHCAENPAIAARQRAERKTFTDSEIIDGFFKTAFGAEFHLAGRVDRIRKYDGPVRVFATGANRPDRKAQLAKVVADIGRRIAHLDISMAATIDDATIVVTLVRDRDLIPTIRRFYGARSEARSIRNACLAFAKTSDPKSSTPMSSSRSTRAISSSSTAPMKNCCNRWGRSTIPIRCPGPCSTTRCRWDSSTSTTSIC